MSRSKGQKARRSRNNDSFKLQARLGGLHHALSTCDLKGVQQVVYDRAYRELRKRERLAYAKQPSAYRPDYEWEIHDRMAGVQRLRQTMRVMKKPLVHIRTVSRLDRKIREVRRHYRKILKDTGWTTKRVDGMFAKHFPSEWAIVQRDKVR